MTEAPQPTETLRRLLIPAYSPCAGFGGSCTTMRWAPNDGHVPRGFCGAIGPPSEVRLVLVVAEPGDPHSAEAHPSSPPSAVLESTSSYAYRCFRDGKDLFHRNVRRILDLCFSELSFDQQMQITWITESVLCSAAKEGGSVPDRVASECRRRYLEPQLRAMPNAVVVALGKKAEKRLVGVSNVVTAFAAAPPGCNFRGAVESWQAAAEVVRAGAV
jgi:hypothetical protein